jgi:RNA polymerase sigma factor (sigma-70 family)
MEQFIIDQLKAEQSKAFEMLYSDSFKSVSRFVLNNNGSVDDAQDVFQEAMMVLVHKIRKDEFKLSASIGTYLMALCKFVWLKRLRNNRNTVSLDKWLQYNSKELEEVIMAEGTYKGKLQKYLHKISMHCQMFIDEVYFKGKTIQQIQQQYNYSTKQNALNQKYKCLEQLRRVKNQDTSN